jgi:ATP-dependent Clp protease adaptor protein ClpS
MPKQQTGLMERERTSLREPRRYKVIIYNDDFTTMDFVVKLLMEIFHKSLPESESLMLQVHKGGQAVVGIYTYDIARTKVERATGMAREAGYPLRLTYQPEA